MADEVRGARTAEPEPEGFVVHRPPAEGVQGAKREDDGNFRVVGRSAERAVALSDLTNLEALDYAQPPEEARRRQGLGPRRRRRR